MLARAVLIAEDFAVRRYYGTNDFKVPGGIEDAVLLDRRHCEEGNDLGKYKESWGEIGGFFCILYTV